MQYGGKRMLRGETKQELRQILQHTASAGWDTDADTDTGTTRLVLFDPPGWHGNVIRLEDGLQERQILLG